MISQGSLNHCIASCDDSVTAGNLLLLAITPVNEQLSKILSLCTLPLNMICVASSFQDNMIFNKFSIDTTDALGFWTSLYPLFMLNVTKLP